MALALSVAGILAIWLAVTLIGIVGAAAGVNMGPLTSGW